jgi:cyanophycinase
MAKRGNGNGKGNGNARGNGKRRSVRAGASAGASAGTRAGARRGTSPRSGVREPVVRARGTLIVVGGREDREGEKLILRSIAGHARGGRLVVATVASDVPDELWQEYHALFRGLGVKDVAHLDVDSREDAKADAKLRILDGASTVFFTGGDQLRITSLLGDSPIYERVKRIYEDGGTVGGTSAGASVVCETMLVSGGSSSSHRIGDALRMAPGLGLLPGAIVDQHFAERGRIGRLIAAVAQNPRILGVGIDENTAIICDAKHCFRVIGAGAVYVVDGADIVDSNQVEEESDRTLSVLNVRLHLLSMADEFDMEARKATIHPAKEVEAAVIAARAG